MKILSVKQGFECDHSAVNYQFVSEGKISNQIKSLLKRRGVEFKVRKNTVSIRFLGERHLSSRVQDEFLTRFDIPLLIYEDYDWWNFILMFDFDEELFNKLQKYEAGAEHTIYATKKGNKIEVWITVHLDYDQTIKEGMDLFKTLRELFLKIRGMILKGNFEPMDILFTYCSEDDLSKVFPATKVGETLKSYLARW